MHRLDLGGGDEGPDGAQHEKPLIVLDAPNIAMQHGGHKLFSTRGISLALEHYAQLGHRVIIGRPPSGYRVCSRRLCCL